MHDGSIRANLDILRFVPIAGGSTKAVARVVIAAYCR